MIEAKAGDASGQNCGQKRHARQGVHSCPLRLGGLLASGGAAVKVGRRDARDTGSNAARPHLDGGEPDATLGPAGSSLATGGLGSIQVPFDVYRASLRGP